MKFLSYWNGNKISGILGEIHSLMVNHKIINISGESGTGKTTLALQMVGTLLTSTFPYEECCIWIQASEPFPLKRLSRMFAPSTEKSSYLQHNIFVTPHRTTLNSYFDQSQQLMNLINGSIILPPNLRFIVIDNISHHLRYEISKYKDIKAITSLIDHFYDSQLLPLIMFCQRKAIYLLFIHETSFDPKANKNRSFLFKLYDRLNTLKIELFYMGNRRDKRVRIFTQNQCQEFQYTLHDRGLVIQ